jgi:hypothetical protein
MCMLCSACFQAKVPSQFMNFLAYAVHMLKKLKRSVKRIWRFQNGTGPTYRYRTLNRQTPIFRHPFFRKQCFSLKHVLVAPPQNFLDVCLNSEYM